MKKLLLVGSNGLVGSHFKALFHAQYHIIAMNREHKIDWGKLPEVDALVFLAQSKEYTLKGFSQDLIDTNVLLVRDYLHHLSGKCPQVILFSTGSVYQESQGVIDESSPLVIDKPNPYAASKLMAEILAKSFSNFYQHIAIVRPFTIYGKGSRPSMLFSRLQTSLENGGPIELGEDGGIQFNPIHAEDAANFIDYLLKRKASGIEYFNLFGPDIVYLSDVIQKIASTLSVQPAITRRQWPLKKSIARTLYHNFIPMISIDKGIQKMIVGESVYVE